MLGLLVITHGGLAEELVAAAERILGPVERMEGLSIGWDDDVDEARQRVQEAVGRLGDEGVLLLTDMFGGTPTNIALSLLEPRKVDVVTGVNLAMLIKFHSLRENFDLDDACSRVADQGRRAIQVASELLEGRPGEEGPA